MASLYQSVFELVSCLSWTSSELVYFASKFESSGDTRDETIFRKSYLESRRMGTLPKNRTPYSLSLSFGLQSFCRYFGFRFKFWQRVYHLPDHQIGVNCRRWSARKERDSLKAIPDLQERHVSFGLRSYEVLVD